MGVCLINDNFEDLRFDFYDKEREEEEKAKRAKQQYKKSQQVIKVDKFQLEKIKKQKLLKKKTHDINNLGIEKNEEILLLSSTKKNKAKTESGHLNESKLFSLRSRKYDIVNYPKDVFELINKIRNKPESFIEDIERALTNIKKYKDKLIYNGNIKIYLNKGEKMFKEAIDFLKKTKSMKPLAFNQEIGIDMPTEEEFNKDKDFFKKKILKEKKIKNIERYYREAIKDPYTGVLMMIVDDTNKNQGEKRITILNPILSKISINCKMYGNKFLAYLTFSK
jgi:hypothetical protein